MKNKLNIEREYGVIRFNGRGTGSGVARGDCTIVGYSRTSNGPKFGAAGPYDGKMEARGAWYGDTARSGKGFG